MGNNNRTILLVYRQMDFCASDTAVDIMLTPQFYMVKKEKLPIRTRYRAQKIAPSLFEGLLEKTSNYRFFVYQEDDIWVFIAYDPEEITAFLQQKGLGPERIGKVYFAEQIVNAMDRPIKLGETEAMSVIDDTVVIVPNSVLKDDIDDKVPALPRPKKSASFEYNDKMLLNKEQAAVLAAILMLFALIWLAEGLRYKKNNNLSHLNTEEMYTKYPSLKSRYTRDSILSKYQKIDTVERKKRKIIGQVADMLFKGVTVELFELNDKGYKVVFSVTDKNVAKRLKEMFKPAGFHETAASAYPKIAIEGHL